MNDTLKSVMGVLASLSSLGTVICNAYDIFNISLPNWLNVILILIIPASLLFVRICRRWIIYAFDKLQSFITPVISWKNDGFAYMTIEARFRDNFYKTKYNFEGADDHYSKFCQEKVLTAEKLTELFTKQDDKDEYIHEYRDKICKLLNNNDINNEDVQYLFSNSSFIFAEHYYFYHILHLFAGKKDDPWVEIKDKSLGDERTIEKIKELIETYGKDDFDGILRFSVFANSTDLSQLECKAESRSLNQYAINSNSGSKVVDYCKNSLKDKQVHIIVDNCGVELISDIILGLFLLKKCGVQKVVYHYNVLPIFVSDTVYGDISKAINAINVCDENDILGKDTIQNLIKENKMVFKPNVFWNMPFPFKEMPQTLLNDNFNNDTTGLIIVKGDLNYRRLVEDRKWKVTKKIDNRVDYFTKPILILRSLKSNTLLGVDRKTAKDYDRRQPNWKIVGDYGIIHFVKR